MVRLGLGGFRETEAGASREFCKLGGSRESRLVSCFAVGDGKSAVYWCAALRGRRVCRETAKP
jgi:hypothetical protein